MPIRNRVELASVGDVATRRTLLNVAERALNALDSARIIRDLLRLEGDRLEVGRRSWALGDFDRIHVIGAGKAANSMARAVEEVLGDRIDGGVVIVKSFEPGDGLKHIDLPEGGHPYPDENGWRGRGPPLPR